jgi:hypothetical protein
MTAATDGGMYIFDLRASPRPVLGVPSAHEDAVAGLQFDETKAVTSSFDSTIRIWELRRLWSRVVEPNADVQPVRADSFVSVVLLHTCARVFAVVVSSRAHHSFVLGCGAGWSSPLLTFNPCAPIVLFWQFCVCLWFRQHLCAIVLLSVVGKGDRAFSDVQFVRAMVLFLAVGAGMVEPTPASRVSHPLRSLATSMESDL